MALTVRDLLGLKQMKKMELVAGRNGLDKIVVTSNIADYEFAPNVTPDNSLVFEAHSFVVSSLLYAKDNPDLIYPSIKSLYEYNVSAFAFKDIIFGNLPSEVIDFANEKGFPIFKFSKGTYFENIIYEVMDAVRHDDNHYLQEGNIQMMIENTISHSEVSAISKGLSMAFSAFSLCAYIKYDKNHSPLNLEYLHRLFLTSKSLRKKAIIATYKNGLFILMTSNNNQMQNYKIMLNEILDYLSIDEKNLSICLSNPHDPYKDLDKCFRESYHCYIAKNASNSDYKEYNDIGLYKLTIALQNNEDFSNYVNDILHILTRKHELFITALSFINNHGHLKETAKDLDCHINTIRYRINQIKELLLLEDKSEYELFAILSPVCNNYLTRKLEESY